MRKIFEAGAGWIFDGAGRWALLLGGVASLLGVFWMRDNRLERLARADERGQVITQVREQTDATIANIKQGAARAAHPAARGVLDPTTRD